jgi:hypothetical protein
MKIKLIAWAEARYNPPPSLWTLRRWVREGELHPAPEMVGNTYYIDQNARRLTAASLPHGSLVDRLKAGEQ